MVIDRSKLQEIERACQILRRGGVVIFPTDTVYGVGCMANSNATVSRLYSIKKKPQDESSPILISRWDELFTLSCKLNEKIESLLKKYWPGALTVLLKSESKTILPPLLKDGKLGLRMPDHALAKELVRNAGFPLVGTSANFHGERPPTKFEEIDIDFIHAVDFVLNGECRHGQESTIVDCTREPFEIIRRGVLNVDPSDL